MQIPENQTFCFVFQSLGIEEEDFPKLSQLLIKHKQQRDQTEVRKESKTQDVSKTFLFGHQRLQLNEISVIR